jgi:MFS family permease
VGPRFFDRKEEEIEVSESNNGINRDRLLWAGFTAILAAGVGFAIRGGIFDNWAAEYSLTGTQLGVIGGAGFIGFCFGIIIGGVVCDKIGYWSLVVAAFGFHVLSAVVTFMASTPENAYDFLYWGMFMFAFANGILEAVANPLVATLYPENRTHYLNIVHASWPAGMILGAACGWVLDDKMAVGWKVQLSLYLIPTVAYGIMFFGQKYPKSEAAEKGAKLGDMFKDIGLLGALVVCYLLSLFFASNLGLDQTLSYVVAGALLVVVGVMTKFSVGSFLLFFLFIAHALVGAVELGTDGWIQNITGNMFTSEQGKMLFLWTSAIMFGLRFCAHFIEEKLGLSPPALLFTCAVLAVVGLQMSSSMETFGMALIALGIYAVGKTFFWPTMLAVASDRFPQTGAVAISFMGGIGMLSAGLIGSAGLGYAKDRYTAEELERVAPEVYAEVKVEKPSKWLTLKPVLAVDGGKLGEANAAEEKTEAQKQMIAASIVGDRKTLKADSAIPAAMAVIYLAMVLYFKGIGGYKPVVMDAPAGGGGEAPAGGGGAAAEGAAEEKKEEEEEPKAEGGDDSDSGDADAEEKPAE